MLKIGGKICFKIVFMRKDSENLEIHNLSDFLHFKKKKSTKPLFGDISSSSQSKSEQFSYEWAMIIT